MKNKKIVVGQKAKVIGHLGGIHFYKMGSIVTCIKQSNEEHSALFTDENDFTQHLSDIDFEVIK